jgi:hypothetical protein
MPRLQNISKYCVSCRSAAFASSNEYSMLTPCSGSCMTPFTMVGCGSPAASRIVGATSMTWWNCERISPFRLDPVRPVDDRAVARAAPVRGDLLGPLIRRVHRVRPADGVVVVARSAVPSSSMRSIMNSGVSRSGAVEADHLVEGADQRALGGAPLSPMM